jgi:anti-anti-sigma factor
MGGFPSYKQPFKALTRQHDGSAPRWVRTRVAEEVTNVRTTTPDRAGGPSAGVRLEIVEAGGYAVISGRLDAGTVGLVRGDLHRLVDDGTEELTLDVGAADIPDSWGLGLLVGVHRRARTQGRTLILLDVPSRLGWLIRHTRLHRVLVCRTSESAQSAVSA